MPGYTPADLEALAHGRTLPRDVFEAIVRDPDAVRQVHRLMRVHELFVAEPRPASAAEGLLTNEPPIEPRKHPIRLPHVRVLKVLSDAGGPLTLSDLTAKAGYSKGSGTASRALYGVPGYSSSGLAQIAQQGLL